MNAYDVMLTERTTAHTGSTAEDYVPDAPTLPFDYSMVVQALPDHVVGTGGTPYMLTIAAQLAAILRARIGSAELGRGQPMPSESTLMQQYGVTREPPARPCACWSRRGLCTWSRTAGPASPGVVED